MGREGHDHARARLRVSEGRAGSRDVSDSLEFQGLGHEGSFEIPRVHALWLGAAGEVAGQLRHAHIYFGVLAPWRSRLDWWLPFRALCLALACRSLGAEHGPDPKASHTCQTIKVLLRMPTDGFLVMFPHHPSLPPQPPPNPPRQRIRLAARASGPGSALTFLCQEPLGWNLQALTPPASPHRENATGVSEFLSCVERGLKTLKGSFKGQQLLHPT